MRRPSDSPIERSAPDRPCRCRAWPRRVRAGMHPEGRRGFWLAKAEARVSSWERRVGIARARYPAGEPLGKASSGHQPGRPPIGNSASFTVHFQTLYAFVVTSLERRRIVHVGVTAHPTGAWVAQRMIEAVGEAPPRYLLHDRDSIYDARFRARLRRLGVRCLLSPPRAPLANAITEAQKPAPKRLLSAIG